MSEQAKEQTKPTAAELRARIASERDALGGELDELQAAARPLIPVVAAAGAIVFIGLLLLGRRRRSRGSGGADPVKSLQLAIAIVKLLLKLRELQARERPASSRSDDAAPGTVRLGTSDGR
jgi:hypothetical protein